MCALAGIWGGRHPAAERVAQLMRMTHAVSHRGPDAQGAWEDPDAAIAIGHRRLAVVEASDAGAQPMRSAGGRYVLSVDGRIHNHLELREAPDLAACEVAWRGRSDAETLLGCLGAWGVTETLRRAVGMFAFALWDRKLRVLTLARDRFGEKPLHYGTVGTGDAAAFLFASELSGFTACRGFPREIDRDSLCAFMRHGHVGGDQSIFRGVHKLLPGHVLTLGAANATPAIEAYWSLARVAEAGAADRFTGGAAEAVERLEALAGRAVREQMTADAPPGAFLSGGVDSSAVVALMQARSTRRVKTFSVGLEEAPGDASTGAVAVARHLGTDHTALRVSAREAIDAVALLPRRYCEPLADPAQIPACLVSQLARRDVAVSLSGDAGNELFGGHDRYRTTPRLWHRLSAMPVPARRATARLMQQVAPHHIDRLAARVPVLRGWPDLGERVQRGARVLGSSSATDLHLRLMSRWSDPAGVVLGSRERASFLTGLRPTLAGLDEVERMMVLDSLTCLPDGLLARSDRAAMGVGLEARAPFLDHRLVEFAWRLPLALKLRRGGATTTPRWIVREMLARHVPRALVGPAGPGPVLPVGAWLRGPLRDWAEALLDEGRLRADGFFDPVVVRRTWREHLAGGTDRQHPLWCVLMFQAWFDAHA